MLYFSCEGNCGIRQDIWELDEKSAEAEFYHQLRVWLFCKRSIESMLIQRSDIFKTSRINIDSMYIQRCVPISPKH